MDLSQSAIVAAITIFIYMNLLYVIALRAKNAGLVDVGWGFGFVLIALVLLLRSQVMQPVVVVVYSLVHLWGLRLVSHLAKRNLGRPEDWRYAKWRKEWGKDFVWRSYFQIFMLQGWFMWLISASIIVVFTGGAGQVVDMSWLVAGIGVWLVGYYFEVVSDWQLSRFLTRKQTKRNKKKIMNEGLWRFSRHPNYFGEILQWWGIWLCVASLPNGPLALISPLTITALILFVSGVPVLERKYARNQAYRRYAKKTSLFLPLPPR